MEDIYKEINRLAEDLTEHNTASELSDLCPHGSKELAARIRGFYDRGENLRDDKVQQYMKDGRTIRSIVFLLMTDGFNGYKIIKKIGVK